MTYYECTECGQLDRPVDVTSRYARYSCPNCDEVTVWEPAFVDEDKGVSF